ncbi:MAG TPA: DUF1592 domain-containing protein [Pirellulales bacterium]|jgi:mono/diheme cytochrome c family protein|nr:DUF1592 domain-containing protein [Pirellulales bacterium]
MHPWARSLSTCLRSTILLLPVIAGALAGDAAAEEKSARPGGQATALPPPVQQALKQYCYECHASGGQEGGLALDALIAKLPATGGRGEGHVQWLAVWNNLRAQMMPPSDEPQPSEQQRQAIVKWIERDVFRLDAAHPDPGRVTLRRLNRVEYASTVHDLLGVEFDAAESFPPDDTGYGFDTIGDVLNISPLLMEKYLEAAQSIVAHAVPPEGPKPPRRKLSPDGFKSPSKKDKTTASRIPFADAAKVRQSVKIGQAGRYRLRFEMRAVGSDEASSNTARVGIAVDDQQLKSQQVGWDANNTIVLSADTKLTTGEHALVVELTPLDPPMEDEHRLYLNVRFVQIEGPLDGAVLEYPPEFRRVFFDGAPPADVAGRRTYARKILRHFADRAFRRPVDEAALDRLVALAIDADPRPKASFEQGIARGLMAILVSPRFLFRAEVQAEPNSPGRIVPLDEFALAARLSYFLWSSLPDDELFKLAGEHRLRENLHAQVERMLGDKRSQRFVENFVGQWLQTRDVDGFNVDARKILNIKSSDDANKIFNRNVRRAFTQETELLFAHLLRENRSARELLTADYTFLNEPLARFYGIDGVKGFQMRKVPLSKDDHRGGILTHGSILLVTSNPTLTSPVKRGLFVLDNLLGTPSAPPPPDVPPLPEGSPGKGRKHTLRELMEVHREKPLCASCHARMDPIGLSLEEYNVLGQWRDKDLGKPLDSAGQLITGEKFADTRELERVIANQRHTDFYRCLAEKMLTYALGRGVEYYDATTVDALVSAMEGDQGRLRTLVQAIVASAPFQQRRGDGEHVPKRAGSASASAGKPNVRSN